jgi:VacB/RNase II family 3'-5' exoribonuclease
MKPTQHDLRDIARRVMIERGLQPEFPAAAIAETTALSEGAQTKDARNNNASVRDLRDRLWCSIDNDDSRDLDQLSVCEPGAGGAVKIFVAIADVDSLVKVGSAIDDHARLNTTSVYTAAGIFPMLPEKLSTDLTSLGENDERLAMVVEMTVLADGAVSASDIYRALVLNKSKLAYDSVAAWLDGTAPAPPRLAAVAGMDEQIRTQDRVAQAMKKRRQARGALDLDTLQTHAVFGGSGELSDLKQDTKNRAKMLIEDFMIAANGVGATFLDAKGYPSIRRVLHTPKRWDRIVDIASQLGEKLPAEPNALALEQFLNRRREADPVRFPDLSLSIVKLLGSGEYAIQRPGTNLIAEGHFGLAVRDYTHSTAPNRRFPDLTTQRLVKAAVAGEKPPTDDTDLRALAKHCTEQEDNAAKVERQVQKSAAAFLLASRLGERFDGIVTGASDKGTWVRIFKPSVEGMVVQGAAGLDVGDQVQVELVRTDVQRGFIDFRRR